MEWLTSLADSNGPAVTIILVTLGLVVALIFLVWVFRKIAGSNAIRTNRNRRPRLAVTDAAVVDDKRRLVLVRRDDVEHLVMIGGASDVVVETNIIRTQAVAVPNAPVSAQVNEPETSTPQPAAAPSTAPTISPATAGGALAAGGVLASGAVAASSETVSSGVQSVKENIGSALSMAADEAPEPDATVMQAVEQIPPPPPEPAIETVAAVEPEKQPSFDQSLEDALQIDVAEPVVDQPMAPKPEAPAVKPTSVEDEMQRLLNELTTEKA